MKRKLARRTEPTLLKYLSEATNGGLQGVRLQRLNEAANYRKRIIELLDAMTQALAEARAVELLQQYRTQEHE